GGRRGSSGLGHSAVPQARLIGAAAWHAPRGLGTFQVTEQAGQEQSAWGGLFPDVPSTSLSNCSRRKPSGASTISVAPSPGSPVLGPAISPLPTALGERHAIARISWSTWCADARGCRLPIT